MILSHFLQSTKDNFNTQNIIQEHEKIYGPNPTEFKDLSFDL